MFPAIRMLLVDINMSLCHCNAETCFFLDFVLCEDKNRRLAPPVQFVIAAKLFGCDRIIMADGRHHRRDNSLDIQRTKHLALRVNDMGH